MDVDRYITESFFFTRDALVWGWQRWLVLVLLGIPWALLTSLLTSRGVYDGMRIHWGLIPWTESALIIVSGIICNLLLTGYLVRLLRGGKTVPGFDRPSGLLLDGIRAGTIPLIWIFVPLILFLAGTTLVAAGYLGSLAAWVVLAMLVIVEIILVFFAVNYIVIGTVRFARTGSVREAFNLPAIKGIFDRIGLVNYYIGLGVIMLVFAVVTAFLNLLALVPYIGPVLVLLLSPLLTVYCARFIAHFCDEDLQPLTRVPEALPPGAWMKESVIWGIALLALTVLCFTPLVLVLGAVGNLVP